jgi:RND family efflux transporter MFP subunit
VEPGTQVGPDTVLATIDDRTRILVDFRVPERFAGRLAIGDPVGATALASPELPLRGEIVALDSRVDPESRTLRVQAALDNPEDELRGGMAFAVELAFEGERFPAVDPLAIQWGAEGAFVWVAREGEAARVPVRIVQRNSDSVLVAGELTPGERVITEGLQRLRPGTPLAFVGDEVPAGSGETES